MHLNTIQPFLIYLPLLFLLPFLEVLEDLKLRLSLSILLLLLLALVFLLIFADKGSKEYESSSWHCEEVRFPKFKDGQMFRSGECIVWKRIIDEEDYEVE